MNGIVAAIAVVGLGFGAVGIAGFGGDSCALSGNNSKVSSSSSSNSSKSSCATTTAATTAAMTSVAMSTEGPGCTSCEAHEEGASCSMCDDKEMTGHDDHAMTSASMETTVDPAEYAAAAWPTYNKGKALYAKDLQGQKLVVALGNETWLTEKIDTKGKVLVLDFWATWCPPCRSALPKLDKMQKANKDTLAILAIGGQRESESTVRSFVEEHEYAISDLFDAGQSVYAPFESEAIPLVVVISTDGVIRWIGNPHQPEFAKAVKQTIKVDPMTKSS
ncbi:MAG: TlpA family protein disulfide reductase [Phycisphaerales bacterium]|nr:TlpA family protein disulfide reductase [Phycisphaerales bacterium]